MYRIVFSDYIDLHESRPNLITKRKSRVIAYFFIRS